MYTQRHCLVHQPAWLGTDRQCERPGRACAFARHAAVELSKQQLDRYILSTLLTIVKVCAVRSGVLRPLLKSAGSLPDTLPAQLNNSDPGNVSLSFIYLSNNSISGSLPAVWGDAVNGWGQFLQGLYLDTNQLTGQLPQLWSDSNSLSNLFRVDLFLNQMTGTVAWNPVNVPSLGNLVLLPGERCVSTFAILATGLLLQLCWCNVRPEATCNVVTVSMLSAKAKPPACEVSPDRSEPSLLSYI